ncbi:MAG TPA: dihydrolipoyl dehydrogenase [Polyangiaceae bacterium]|jgi:dihydrolipoamide dehydrogenase|nr:dihydrolipoyl dehydrogenase [Polyangiaceae bacterium]
MAEKLARATDEPRAARRADVAIIGAGTAGLAAFRAAEAHGARAVLIEGGEYGTTCARVGCMPSKLLISAADAAHAAREAAGFGVRTTVHVDAGRVMERVHRERDRFVGLVVEGVEAIPAERRLRGYARFVAPGVLVVDQGDAATRVDARTVVLATGSSSTMPAVLEGVRDRVVMSEDVLAWDTFPASAAVFGAGAIGLELGQALSRLGVRVHVFGHGGAVGQLTDPMVRAAAVAALRREIAIDVNAKVHAVRPEGDGVEVRFEDDAGEAGVERFAVCLAATGRAPNLDRLALDRADLALDRRGVPAYDRDTMQCEARSGAGARAKAPVFLAGDIDQDSPVLHEAADEGKIAGENAARYPDVRPAVRSSPLTIVFTDPQIAAVGASYDELPREALVGEVDFGDQGRSRVMLQNRGALRVYATPERFLGAEMAAPRAEHLGHLLAWAHQQRMTVQQMLAMAFYHPVVEEGLRTALRDVDAKLKAAG